MKVATEVKGSEKWEAVSMSIYSVAWRRGEEAGKAHGEKIGKEIGKETILIE